MKVLTSILVLVVVMGCKKVQPSGSTLAVTNSKPVEKSEDAPGAVLLRFGDGKGKEGIGTGVRIDGKIYTSAHVVEGEYEFVDVSDYSGKPIGSFTLHSPDVRVLKDKRYQGRPQDPNDRAALIFQGRGLEALDKGMEHYGPYKSAQFSSKPFGADGRYRTVGGGPADYAYQEPQAQPLSPQDQAEFQDKGLTGQLRMTDSDGSNFFASGDRSIGIYRGYPHQNGEKPLGNSPPNGLFGVTMPGDSGGPIYEVGPDGSKTVAGLTQFGGYAIPVYDESIYPPTRNPDGSVDFNNTAGGINNEGQTYRYPEYENGAATGQVNPNGVAESGFNSSSGSAFQDFISEADAMSQQGW